ncbi:DUF4129 domain-containing protein [Cystobacter fuscus]|uniref:DUF4129 domain-containing protein n=1 Tax=Cystobacter fuscus TaxID=43 RepID=UPI002B287EF9|nr:DUF4129 domain-containing protein [Cystobacter fuscus]
MAVSALELRPRGAVALMDAALRLCVRGSGLWALTLPGGVLVTAALLHLMDAVSHRRPLALPALVFTLAWLARGLFQGAACHHVQQLLLGQGPEAPSVRDSLRAALARAPSLLCAVAYLLVFNTVTLGVTLGLAYVFLSAHIVGYAATLQGRGSPLNLYGQCAKLLGPAKITAIGVRLLLLVQGLVLLNLHIAANALFYVGRKLLGIDLTFAERFASLDNPSWDVFLVAVTFTLFEPLRAATASLLLIDGRVRQEGLDLLAAVQQLPVRKPALGLLALLGMNLLAPTAQARPAASSEPSGDLVPRVETLAGACEWDEAALEEWRRTLTSLGPAEARKVARLVRSVEAEVEENEECAALERLDEGLALAASTTELERQRADAASARTRARDILARPEFQEPAPRAEQEEASPDDTVPNGLWERFVKWLEKTLEELFRRRPDPTPPRSNASGLGGEAVANVLVVVLVTAALGVLAVVLWRAFNARGQADEGARLEVSSQSAATFAADPMNALARAPEGWAHLADELAARGEYREAVRGLYLALLSRLHHQGAIHYDPRLSNWDYLRQFRGRSEWVPPLRELTLRFDFAWYGNLPVGMQGYRDFRAMCAPMLSTPAVAEPARA